VSAALAAAPNTHIPLTVSIDIDQLRTTSTSSTRSWRRAPRDTPCALQHLRPHLSKARNGFDILPRPTRTRLKEAIRANSRGRSRSSTATSSPR
jgi:hypothetical protein